MWASPTLVTLDTNSSLLNTNIWVDYGIWHDLLVRVDTKVMCSKYLDWTICSKHTLACITLSSM